MPLLLRVKHENEIFDKDPSGAHSGQDWTKIVQQDHGADNIFSAALTYRGDWVTRYMY